MRLYIYILIISNLIFGQLVWWTHSELEWKTIETEHFKIHFYDKTERSAREAAEIAVIEEFLPEQMEEEQIVAAAREAIQQVEAHSIKDMGKVMGKLKESFKGRMDFSKASKIVKKLLH